MLLFWQMQLIDFACWIRNKALRLIKVYASKDHAKPSGLFRWIEAFLTTPHQVVLVGDSNAVLDPYLDRIGERSVTNNPDVKPFRDFIDRFDLIDVSK